MSCSTASHLISLQAYPDGCGPLEGNHSFNECDFEEKEAMLGV